MITIIILGIDLREEKMKTLNNIPLNLVEATAVSSTFNTCRIVLQDPHFMQKSYYGPQARNISK